MIINHGDTAGTAKVKDIYHGVHGEKQNSSLSFSVYSVISVVNLGFRRVAVVKGLFL
jgi:hypothetical protein